MEKNTFIELLKKAKRDRWCTRIFCTTCGCMQFRNEMRAIGIDVLIKDMYRVDPEEVYELDNWFECTEVAYYDLQQVFWLRPEKKLPEIVLELERIKWSIREAGRIWREKRDEEEKIRREKAAAIKAERQALRNEAREKKSKARESILKEFMAGSIETQLRFIAQDEDHLPDYYPLKLNDIPAETINNLDKETLHALELRFTKLKKQEWRNFYERLINLAEFLPLLKQNKI